MIDQPTDDTHPQPISGDRAFVVIPAYNESAMLPRVLRSVTAIVPRDRIILVNDGSTDGSGNIGREAGVFVIDHLVNRGQGAALATGIQAALRLGARAVVTFDADGQHDHHDIPAMLEPVLAGRCHVVLGTRFSPRKKNRVPWLRVALLKLGVLYARMIWRLRVTDVHNGFRAMSAEAAARITIRQDRMGHATEILEEIRKHGLTYTERPVRVRYSTYSLTKGQQVRHAIPLVVRHLLYRAAG